MKCFAIFKTDVQKSHRTGYLLLVLADDGDERWFAFGSETMRFIAEGINTASRHFVSEMSKDAVDNRRDIFERDASRLEGRRRTPSSAPIEAVVDWRLDLLPEYFVLDVLVESGWRRYLVDVVCAANLMEDIRTALALVSIGDTGRIH